MSALSVWAWQQDWGGPVEKLIAMHIAAHHGRATFEGMAKSANTTRKRAVNALDRLMADKKVIILPGAAGARYVLADAMGGYTVQMDEQA